MESGLKDYASRGVDPVSRGAKLWVILDRDPDRVVDLERALGFEVFGDWVGLCFRWVWLLVVLGVFCLQRAVDGVVPSRVEWACAADGESCPDDGEDE